MKTKLTQKQIRFQALLLFFITFFLVELCAVFLYQNQLKEAKLKADYTAQTTIGRVKSQFKPLSCRIQSDETHDLKPVIPSMTKSFPSSPR